MEKQEPVQINAANFPAWIDALRRAGIAVEVEPPSDESLHDQLTKERDL